MALYKGAASEAGRALQLKKKREKALEELEHRKRKIEEEMKLSNMENKFATHYDAVEQQLKSSTIGLVTLTEMKAKQQDVVKERERQLAQKQYEKELQRQREIQEKREKKEKQIRQIAALSFRIDEEEEEDESDGKEDSDSSSKKESPSEDDNSRTSLCSDETDVRAPKRQKIGKNPDVDTSFLPDREREEEERRMREELRQEWVQKQEKLKNEEIEITFSYWDGSGHRRSVKMKKGNSVYQFLQKCLELLRKEFHELRAVTADQLMYVKEDLIIPHHYTFYDFIVTKARVSQSGRPAMKPLSQRVRKQDARRLQEAGVIVGAFGVFFMIHGCIMVVLNMVLETRMHTSLAQHILVYPALIAFATLGTGSVLCAVAIGCAVRAHVLLRKRQRPATEDKQTFCNEDELRRSFREAGYGEVKRPGIKTIAGQVPYAPPPVTSA